MLKQALEWVLLIWMLFLISEGLIVSFLILLVFYFRPAEQKNIRAVPLGKYALIGLLLILITAAFSSLQVPGINGLPPPPNEEDHHLPDYGGQFNFTVYDSPWFASSVTVEVSFYAEYIETVTVTLYFTTSGNLVAQEILEFDIGFGRESTVSREFDLDLDPGLYIVGLSGDKDRDFTVSIAQEWVDGRDIGQKAFDILKVLFLLGGGGFGGFLLVYVARGGYMAGERTVRRKEIDVSSSQRGPLTIRCASCDETITVVSDEDGISTCPYCGKRQII